MSGAAFPVPAALSEWRKAQLRYVAELPKEDVKLIEAYGTEPAGPYPDGPYYGAEDSFVHMNRYLSRPNARQNDKFQPRVERLQRIIWNAPRLPSGIVVFRTVTDDGLTPGFMKDWKVGGTYKSLGFQSTTLNPSLLTGKSSSFGYLSGSEEQAFCCQMVIELSPGTPALDFSGLYAQERGNDDEAELLLPHGLCWKLLSIQIERRPPGVAVTVYRLRVMPQSHMPPIVPGSRAERFCVPPTSQSGPAQQRSIVPYAAMMEIEKKGQVITTAAPPLPPPPLAVKGKNQPPTAITGQATLPPFFGWPIQPQPPPQPPPLMMPPPPPRGMPPSPPFLMPPPQQPIWQQPLITQFFSPAPPTQFGFQNRG